MDTLPYEIFTLIINDDIKIYCGLLAIPFFTRMLTTGKIIDNMIKFGYDVKIITQITYSDFNGDGKY